MSTLKGFSPLKQKWIGPIFFYKYITCCFRFCFCPAATFIGIKA